MEPSVILIIVIAVLAFAQQVRAMTGRRLFQRALVDGIAPTLSLKGGIKPTDADGTLPPGLEVARSDDAVLHRAHLLGYILEAGFYVRRWEEILYEGQENRPSTYLTRRVVFVQVRCSDGPERSLRLKNAKGSSGREWMRDSANGPDVLLSDDSVRIDYLGHFPPELPPRRLLQRCLQIALALSHNDDTCAHLLAAALDLADPRLDPQTNSIGAREWAAPLAPMPLSLSDGFFDLLLSYFPETSAALTAARRADADADPDRSARAFLVRCTAPESSTEMSRYRAVVTSSVVKPDVRTLAFHRLWPQLDLAGQVNLIEALEHPVPPPLSDAVFASLPALPSDAALAAIDAALDAGETPNARALYDTLSQMEPTADTGPRLLRLLDPSTAQLAARIAALLVARGHHTALEDRLMDALETGPGVHRDFAIIKLGTYGSARAVPPLKALLGGWTDSELKTMVNASVDEIQARARAGAGGLALTAASDKAGGLSAVNDADETGGLSTPE